MEGLYLFSALISIGILYLVISGANKTLTRLALERIQLKVLIEIAKKLEVPEADIMKHFTNEKNYNTFSKKKTQA